MKLENPEVKTKIQVFTENLPPGWVHVPGIYTGPDRRKKPTPMFSRFLFWGKRRKNLVGPAHDYFTDRMTLHSWGFFLATVVLSTVDALFSINFIMNHGFREINPVLEPLISKSSWSFLIGKYLLTVGGLVFLIVHQHFKIFSYVVVFVLIAYSALCGYHIYLLFGLPN